MSDNLFPSSQCTMTHRGESSAAGVASNIGRRNVLLGLGAFAISGCVATPRPEPVLVAAPPPAPSRPVQLEVPPMYYPLPDEEFPIPEVDVTKVAAKFWRQDVPYPSEEKAGTLIVDTPAKHLYHVKGGGRATRYGIGVGREGFAWSGRAIVAYRRKWPRWTPPDSMVARQPELQPYSIANGGMAPGLRNPLGSRALYIHQDGRDTLYRLHGTYQPGSIGKAVSSGCIRLLNQDVIHLYEQVRDGSSIVVIPDPSMERYV